MALKLPDPLKAMLRDKAYGHVITFNSKGRPEITMVWMDVDGDEVLFNTTEVRRKTQNLRRDPRVIVSIQDRNNPQSYVTFHGTAKLTEEGAEDHIDTLARRFLNVDKFQSRRPGDKRVIARVSVDRIGGFAPGFKPWV